jgi:hypothetical protein
MSISNLFVPNDYKLYINNQNSDRNLIVLNLASTQVFNNASSVILGLTTGKGWIQTGTDSEIYEIEDDNGHIEVLKSGLYKVSLKLKFFSGTVANTNVFYEISYRKNSDININNTKNGYTSVSQLSAELFIYDEVYVELNENDSFFIVFSISGNAAQTTINGASTTQYPSILTIERLQTTD